MSYPLRLTLAWLCTGIALSCGGSSEPEPSVIIDPALTIPTVIGGDVVLVGELQNCEGTPAARALHLRPSAVDGMWLRRFPYVSGYGWGPSGPIGGPISVSVGGVTSNSGVLSAELRM